jgi:hypothetical protein
VSLDVIMQKSVQEIQVNSGAGSIIPFLAPIEYKKKITERATKAKKVKDGISKAGLNKEQKEMVMNAVQGYFREWMSGTHESKLITELVKWIDSD